MKPKNNRHPAIAALLLVALAGCRVGVPDDIIQVEQMEALLYDYHLAQAMVQNTPKQSPAEKEGYYQYVFDKHHTTRAEFDSSMVWYQRHPKYLSDIYLHLQEKYRRQDEALTAQTEQAAEKPARSLSGDSVDLWYLGEKAWLWNVPLAQRLAFSIAGDTSFYKNDTYEWRLTARFLQSEEPAADTLPQPAPHAYMAMQLLFANDSTAATACDIVGNGNFKLALASDSGYTLKELRGFVYFEQDSTRPVQSLLLRDIALIRQHRPDSTATAAAPNSQAK